MERRSCATMGPCWDMSPSQTSSSSTYYGHKFSNDIDKQREIITLETSQTSIKAPEKTESPRTATPLRTSKRVRQESQSTACSIAVTISPAMLALQARKRLKIRVNLANFNIVQAEGMYGRWILPNICCAKTGRLLGYGTIPRPAFKW